MPNGPETNMDSYCRSWCDERHKRIDEEFTTLWSRIETLKGQISSLGKMATGILVGLVLNLLGIIGLLLIQMLSSGG